ncbi:MAG: hypothetical protein WCP06_10235 [Verrucomicrobiota bacterium]
MKTPILFAFISVATATLTLFGATGCTSPQTYRHANSGWRNRTGQTANARKSTPPVVAEQSAAVAQTPKTVDGVVPRVLTASDPAQMINPLAPPEYGSGRDLVVYTERDPYRTDNENKRRLQPDGLRLLTIRPLW